MGELVREQRSGVEVVITITMLPPIGGGPRCVAAFWEGMGRRTETQNVEQQSFVVAFPPVVEEAAFWLPAVRHRCTLVLRPLPIGAAIERVAKGADFTLVYCTVVEIDARRQRAGQQECAIHCRQFALPGATA